MKFKRAHSNNLKMDRVTLAEYTPYEGWHLQLSINKYTSSNDNFKEGAIIH